MTSIKTLNLSNQVNNALMRAGIFTTEDLSSKNKTDLLNIRWVGVKALDEIEKACETNNIQLKAEVGV